MSDELAGSKIWTISHHPLDQASALIILRDRILTPCNAAHRTSDASMVPKAMKPRHHLGVQASDFESAYD